MDEYIRSQCGDVGKENINKKPTVCESWEEIFPLVIKKG